LISPSPRFLQNHSNDLRIGVGAPPPAEKVKPLTTLLREGLDQATSKTYFIHEEEVPRAGVFPTQYDSRTGWTAGEVFVWFRAQKQTGRGKPQADSDLIASLTLNAKEACDEHGQIRNQLL